LAVLAVGAATLFVVQRGEISENIDLSLSERAAAIEELFVAGTLPLAIVGDDEDRLVQVVDSSGGVLIASERLQERPPLVMLASDSDDVTISELSDPDLGPEPFRVLSRRSANSAHTIHVAESLDDLAETSAALLTTLFLIVPTIAAVFGLLAWALIGRTLRPVDSLRAQVDAIADTRHLQRLPDPGRNDEIGRLTTTLNGMLDRLHRSGEQQRRFVADAAHELRTPLTRIRTSVEVDLAQPVAAVPDRTNIDVQQEAIGMQRLIDDLLLLASGDDGLTGLERQLIDLDDLAMNEIHQHRSRNPAVTIDSSGVRPCEYNGNEAQLRRVTQNLLSNAIRHATSQVAVSLETAGQSVQLTVEDDGPGVPVSERATIFNRFTRLDEARTSDGGGAGLGLAITSDIVDRHGGTIDCADSTLGGARFVVRLPLPAMD
jgi:signal transduction histidine kinase